MDENEQSSRWDDVRLAFDVEVGIIHGDADFRRKAPAVFRAAGGDSFPGGLIVARDTFARAAAVVR